MSKIDCDILFVSAVLFDMLFVSAMIFGLFLLAVKIIVENDKQ